MSALRILIVEDDAEVLDLLLEISEHLGHAARGCTRASIAKELLLNEQFDLLLTDYKLPHMSGVELAKISVNYHDMRTVVTSGLAKPDDLPVGADWLQKPFDMADFEELCLGTRDCGKVADESMQRKESVTGFCFRSRVGIIE